MADPQPQAVPPMPPKGEIVSAQSLYLTQISLYRNSLAFGGQRNPSAIWSSMVYNHPWTMAYYRELEDKDEDVANALDSLKLSVLERDLSILPANDSDSLAVDVKEFVEQQLEQIDFHSVLDCVLDAPGYGFSVQEMIFDTSEGQASLLGIEDCPQELFLFGDRYQPQVGNLQLLNSPWESTGSEVPEQKFLIFTYRKRARSRIGRPLLKSVFWPSWFKRNMQRLWMQYAEKGPGTAVVRYNAGATESEKAKAVETAQAIVDSVAIAMSTEFQYDSDLLKIARSQDPAVYEKFFMAMQYSIARRVLGETLTSFGNEGGRGSNAQGNTHADTLNQRSVELCRSLQSVINRQLIRPLVLWNYGPKAPMPKWTMDLEEEEDQQKRLQIDTGLQRMGKKFSVGYVVDRYDVPLVEDENPEDVLTPNTQAPTLPPDEDDPDAPEFSERASAEAKQELKEFDDLFASLHEDATGILRQRTQEIANSAIPVVRY